MLSYGGTYSLSPSKVVHHIDIAWDGRRLGTDQVRFYSVSGDSLILKTEPNNIFALSNLGVIRFRQERLGEAETLLNKALDTNYFDLFEHVSQVSFQERALFFPVAIKNNLGRL